MGICLVFNFSASMNDAVINMHEQIFVWTYVFIALANRPRSRIAVSDSCIFNILRDYQSVFQSSCIILHPYQQCIQLLKLNGLFLKNSGGAVSGGTQ